MLDTVSSKRLRKYHIRHMSDLALSFSHLKDMLVGENLESFWEEAMEIRKARRYHSGMLADLLEAARKLRVQDPEVRVGCFKDTITLSKQLSALQDLVYSK